MAIAYRASNTAVVTSSTSLTITKPTGTTSGDLLVAMICDVGGGGAASCTPPAGWTLVRSDIFSGSNVIGRWAWKIAGGSEPASYTFTFDVSLTVGIGAVLAYSGTDTSTPFNDNQALVDTTADVNLDFSSVTTGYADSLVLYMGAHGWDTTVTPPGGFTERVDVNTGGNFKTITVGDKIQASPGASGTFNAVTGFSANSVGYSIAVNPPIPIAKGASLLLAI